MRHVALAAKREVHVFGSQLFEVAVGLVFIYLSLSIAIIAPVFRRFWQLFSDFVQKCSKKAFALCSEDPGPIDLVSVVYAHPLVRGTVRPGEKPDYISSRSF